MFGNFTSANALVNMEANNLSITSMKPVINEYANCWSPPYIYKNKVQNNYFYFSEKGEKTLYLFNNNQGYNDFIVVYTRQETSGFHLNLELSSENKSQLLYNGEILEKLNSAKIKEDATQIIEMYNRAYPFADQYYCNPAYNYFEEHGINIHAGSYKKIEKNGAFYYFDSTAEPLEDSDYNNKSKIYEYQKISPTVLTDKIYSIVQSPVFNVKCND